MHVVFVIGLRIASSFILVTYGPGWLSCFTCGQHLPNMQVFCGSSSGSDSDGGVTSSGFGKMARPAGDSAIQTPSDNSCLLTHQPSTCDVNASHNHLLRNRRLACSDTHYVSRNSWQHALSMPAGTTCSQSRLAFSESRNSCQHCAVNAIQHHMCCQCAI